MGFVVLVAALVPLLKGTLLKEGTAEELAASSTANDLAGEGVGELGTSSTADDSARWPAELGTSSTGEAFAGEGVAVYRHSALAQLSRFKGISETYHCDCDWSLGHRHGYLRRA